MLRQRCGRCGSRVYFDNWACLACGARLALLPDLMHLAALEARDAGRWVDVRAPEGPAWRLCSNAVEHAVCNGILEEDQAGTLCRACRFTQQIPSLSVARHVEYWRRLEAAKRRLLFTLADLRLRPVPKSESPDGLEFAFGADIEPGHRFMTAHNGGTISINILEADDVERERIRTGMGEPYRSLLGHFRHESGHYYLDRLRASANAEIEWRIKDRFGDMDSDYDVSLAAYYAGQAAGRADPGQFISTYATAHPQEDWAETWAHYLLIRDTLQSASEAGVEPAAAGRPRTRRGRKDRSRFGVMIQRWLPLAELANELSRSLGTADAYPFVLTGVAAEKMELIDALVHEYRDRLPPVSGTRIAPSAASCTATESTVN